MILTHLYFFFFTKRSERGAASSRVSLLFGSVASDKAANGAISLSTQRNLAGSGHNVLSTTATSSTLQNNAKATHHV